MRDRVTLRPFQESDIPFLCALYASTRQEEMKILPWPEEEKQRFLEWQFEAQTKHYFDSYDDAGFMIIELDGTPIGRLFLFRGEKSIEVVDIALVPELRGKGLGRELLQEVIDEARSAGRQVAIYVEHNNPARHLYDRLGFELVDTVGVYHHLVWKSVPT
jgi:ribosomal protein S18 acetylase RimI-like enzyme